MDQNLLLALQLMGFGDLYSQPFGTVVPVGEQLLYELLALELLWVSAEVVMGGVILEFEGEFGGG
jgi:hypothetical protein